MMSSSPTPLPPPPAPSAAEPWIKVCGVTTVADAIMACDAGANAIGINLWPSSPRSVDLQQACALAAALRAHSRPAQTPAATSVAIVAVVVDMPQAQLRQVATQLQPHYIQLHGSETAAQLTATAALAPVAPFKALGLASQEDSAAAIAMPGPFVLVDAKDTALKGGTGQQPPRALAQQVCAARPTILAGGLNPSNVAAAIQACRPVGVDTASGVEGATPGRKDPAKVAAYVQAARTAFAQLLPNKEHSDV